MDTETFEQIMLVFGVFYIAMVIVVAIFVAYNKVSEEDKVMEDFAEEWYAFFEGGVTLIKEIKEQETELEPYRMDEWYSFFEDEMDKDGIIYETQADDDYVTELYTSTSDDETILDFEDMEVEQDNIYPISYGN